MSKLNQSVSIIKEAELKAIAAEAKALEDEKEQSKARAEGTLEPAKRRFFGLLAPKKPVRQPYVPGPRELEEARQHLTDEQEFESLRNQWWNRLTGAECERRTQLEKKFRHILEAEQAAKIAAEEERIRKIREEARPQIREDAEKCAQLVLTVIGQVKAGVRSGERMCIPIESRACMMGGGGQGYRYLMESIFSSIGVAPEYHDLDGDGDITARATIEGCEFCLNIREIWQPDDGLPDRMRPLELWVSHKR